MVRAGFRDSPERALAPGEVIASTYAVRDELARTETGVVYEARDMLLDRAVALKIGWRDRGTPSMVAEARRCAAVNDHCAVAIHGMGTHNGAEYIVGERVTGILLRELLDASQPPEVYLAKLRALIAAVAHAHEAGIAIGDISGSTVLVDARGRMVLGRLSLSQVPAFGPHGQVLAPEVVRGEVDAGDPAAAEAIDLYGLGGIAVELACGSPPFADDDRDAELRGHAFDPPPRLADLRPDVPVELSDLVEWLLAKQPAARPRSVDEVLLQLDAITERLGKKNRSIRVLVVDDDAARGRWLWSLARRAHPAAQVEIAREGTDAAHKLNRDSPDLVFVDATLRGVMNALELIMYARGLESDVRTQLVAIGDLSERDRALFAGAHVPFLHEGADLANQVIDRVRAVASESPRRRKPRTTVSG